MSAKSVKDLVAAAGEAGATRKAKTESIKALKPLNEDERAAFIVCECHDGDRGVLRHAADGAPMTEESIEKLLASAVKKLNKPKAKKSIPA